MLYWSNQSQQWLIKLGDKQLFHSEAELKISFLSIQTFNEVFYSLSVTSENIHILKAILQINLLQNQSIREVKMRIQV